jgi:predicted RNase H-like HicB family nuclease
MIVTVVLEKTPNNWGAFAPDLEDCVIATGQTRQETIDNFRDALLELFASKRREGQTPPDVTELEIRERLPMAEALAA